MPVFVAHTLRRHGARCLLVPALPHVKTYVRALARVVGPTAIVAASEMYGKVVFFLASEATTQEVVERGLVVQIQLLTVVCDGVALEGSFLVPYQGAHYRVHYMMGEAGCFFCQVMGHIQSSAGAQPLFCPSLQAARISQGPHQRTAVDWLKDELHCFLTDTRGSNGKASAFLGTLDPHECLVLGGNFKTTPEDWDRSRTKRSQATVGILREIVDHHALVDVWRDHHPDDDTTFTYVRVEDNRSCHSRLIRIYLSRFHLAQAHASGIRLAPFTDHHLVTVMASVSSERWGWPIGILITACWRTWALWCPSGNSGWPGGGSGMSFPWHGGGNNPLDRAGKTDQSAGA
ncbi:uncharacterized protein LOC123346801 [Mauremys mutica]|uniref:uncharacterized protein LOC123346801 n=1 Tax=Mauremys mutica TaxID=74926 RepID=UPI001D166CDE|nr:uncharacterized protein LOC123346801 [Mauremys mutica]